MRYVWDLAKDALNRKKHGLSLADRIPAVEDRCGKSGLTIDTITPKSASSPWG